jgi:peptide deformylase
MGASKVDRSVKNLIEDLKDTLAAHSDGIGFAVLQNNVHQRFLVVHLGALVDGSIQPAQVISAS